MGDIQAVILAAGRGKRMLPLSKTMPKPLQRVAGKTLLEWKLAALPESIKEIILVIGYQGKHIQAYIGDEWRDKRIRYVWQNTLDGTMGALRCAQDILNNRFLVLMGDDLYDTADILTMLGHEWAIGVVPVTQQMVSGEICPRRDGTLEYIREETHFVEHGLINTGMYMLQREIFDYPPVRIGLTHEFGLPHTLALLAQHIPVRLVHVTKWFRITTPSDLSRAEQEWF